MKKMEKSIIRNWIWFVIGIVLTKKAVEFAYISPMPERTGAEASLHLR
ncbi:MAG: hypothetical protein ACLSWE_03965 [[Clostridium] symbiosum]